MKTDVKVTPTETKIALFQVGNVLKGKHTGKLYDVAMYKGKKVLYERELNAVWDIDEEDEERPYTIYEPAPQKEEDWEIEAGGYYTDGDKVVLVREVLNKLVQYTFITKLGYDSGDYSLFKKRYRPFYGTIEINVKKD